MTMSERMLVEIPALPLWRGLEDHLPRQVWRRIHMIHECPETDAYKVTFAGGTSVIIPTREWKTDAGNARICLACP
jgi:hypothetical protein